jgi:hypothetical protein
MTTPHWNTPHTPRTVLSRQAELLILCARIGYNP